MFGTGLRRYTDGFAESLDLLLAWLSGPDEVGADGSFFRFPPVPVVPTPRRPVPVWIAATGDGTARLAAARGLPRLLGIHATDDEKRCPARHHAPHASATTGQYTCIDGTAGPARDPHAYLGHLLDIHPVGSPELCARRLTETVTATGVRRLLLMLEGAADAERTLANIARFGAEVLPQVRVVTDTRIGI